MILDRSSGAGCSLAALTRCVRELVIGNQFAEAMEIKVRTLRSAATPNRSNAAKAPLFYITTRRTGSTAPRSPLTLRRDGCEKIRQQPSRSSLV